MSANILNPLPDSWNKRKNEAMKFVLSCLPFSEPGLPERPYIYLHKCRYLNTGLRKSSSAFRPMAVCFQRPGTIVVKARPSRSKNEKGHTDFERRTQLPTLSSTFRTQSVRTEPSPHRLPTWGTTTHLLALVTFTPQDSAGGLHPIVLLALLIIKTLCNLMVDCPKTGTQPRSP